MEKIEGALLLCKAESTYGTDPTPTTTENLIPPANDSLTYDVETTEVNRKPLDGTHDALPGYNALPNVTLKFSYEIRGNLRNGTTQLDISNGTSTQGLEIHPLLAAADLSATYTAAGTPGSEGASAGTRDGYVTYKPALTTGVGSSVALYWYSGLKLHKLLGGKVDLSLSFEAGKIPMIDFTVRGKYAAVSDVALPTSNLTWSDTKPEQYLPSVFTIGGYAPVFRNLKVDLGNNIIMRPNALATDGVQGFVIAGRNSRASFDPESVAIADNSFFAHWLAGTEKSLISTHGSSGNKLTVTLNTIYRGLKYANADKLRNHDAQLQCVKSALSSSQGSDFQLKFF